jgi:hypothetical protein
MPFNTAHSSAASRKAFGSGPRREWATGFRSRALYEMPPSRRHIGVTAVARVTPSPRRCYRTTSGRPCRVARTASAALRSGCRRPARPVYGLRIRTLRSRTGGWRGGRLGPRGGRPGLRGGGGAPGRVLGRAGGPGSALREGGVGISWVGVGAGGVRWSVPGFRTGTESGGWKRVLGTGAGSEAFEPELEAVRTRHAVCTGPDRPSPLAGGRARGPRSLLPKRRPDSP